MLRKLLLALSIALPVAISPTAVIGDDTDIYVDNSSSAAPSSKPLVMFSIDYSPNLGSTICSAVSRQAGNCNVDTFFLSEGFDASALPALTDPITFFDVLRLSLRLVLRETSGYKAGLMLNHNQTGNCAGPSNNPTCSNGAYIARRFRSINSVVAPDATDTDASRIELLNILDSLPLAGGFNNHPYQGTEMFFELFRYLTGQRVYNGGNGRDDYPLTGTLDNLGFLNQAGSGDNIAVGRDTLAAEGGSNTERTYKSPLLEADACTKIFTINFLFQNSIQDSDSNSAASAARSSGGLGITVPNNASNFPTVIGFLRDVDLAPETNKFNSSLSWTFTDDSTTTTLGYLPGIQNVSSFFIARPTPEPGPNQPDPDVFSFDLKTEGYAQAGGTERPQPLSKDPAKLVAAIRNALQQILSVSTTLVAASVPVNVFNRSEIVDNVYFALFQAQGAGSPEATNVPGGSSYWPGNLKRLHLGTTSAGRPEIQDATGQPAIATLDGRLLSGALSFWTDTDGTKLSAGDRNGDGITDSTDSDGDGIGNDFTPALSGPAANPPDFITKKDGRIIARGGAGQKIPGFTGTGPGDTNPSGAPVAGGPRKLFYLNAGLQALNSNLTNTEVKTQLGDSGMSNTDAGRLLKYARGQDVNDADGDNNEAESRYWILGDPLHSRPLPINYGLSNGHGSTRNPAIFIAMASNDGYLRMFRNTGGTTTDTATPTQLGQEVWAFMPPEGMAIQKQLMNQSAPVGQPAHAYSFDGEPTALIIDQDGDGTIESGDRVVLYIGLRRGGSAFYALDVTDPLNPVFLWRITPGGVTTSAGFVTGTESNFAEMGQTFSRPRVGLVKLGTNTDGSDVRRLAVFFGGGYDGGYAGSLDEDGKPVRLGNDIDGQMANDSKGNAIYVVRANNAELLWKAVKGTGSPTKTVFQHASLNDSIPSNLTTVDSDADGVVDRVYVGDTGGTVWRADLGGDTDSPANGPTDDWKLTVLAKLGRHSYTSPTRLNDRRFFHEPDVIQSRDSTGRFDAVVMGSGDREDPLDQGNDVDNYFYVIKDRNIGIGAGVDSTRTHDSLTDVTNRCLAGSTLTCEINAEGWRLALDNSPNGEKALSAPVTIANSIFFTTYVPPPPASTGLSFSCGPKEGNGFLYSLKLATGAPARNYNSTDGATNPDGSGTTDDDRDKELDTPGIPAQVVYLGSPTTSSGGSACVVNILAGAQVFEAPGCPRFRTFWQRVGQ